MKYAHRMATLWICALAFAGCTDNIKIESSDCDNVVKSAKACEAHDQAKGKTAADVSSFCSANAGGFVSHYQKEDWEEVIDGPKSLGGGCINFWVSYSMVEMGATKDSWAWTLSI